MKTHSLVSCDHETNLSRRRFVKGLAAGSLCAGLGMSLPMRPLWAMTDNRTQTLRGNEFDLHIGEQAVNFTGRAGPPQ